MRFLVSGGYGYANVGDEAQVAGILTELKENFPRSTTTLLSPNPEYTQSVHKCDDVVLASRVCVFGQKRFPWLYNIRNTRTDGLVKRLANSCLKVLFWLLMVLFFFNCYLYKYFGFCVASSSQRRLIRELGNCDCLFVSGGGYLTEATLSRLLDTSMLMLAAGIFDKSVILSGQTVGHLKSPFNRYFFSKALSKTSLVATRDPEDSMDSLKGLLGKSYEHKGMFTSDDALFVKSEFNTSDYVGYIGIQLHYWGMTTIDHVLDFYCELVSGLKEEVSAKIVLFSMHPSDEPALMAVREKFPDIKFFEYDYDYHKIIDFLGQLDAVVSMKHHPLIFAMGQGVPAVSVNYSEYYRHKNVGAMLNFGMEACAVNLVDGPGKVLEHVRSFLVDDNVIRKKILTGVEEAKARRIEFWKRVKEFV